MSLTHIDLFSGIAGFSLGFEKAGITTVAHVEIDKNCQNIIKRHFPDRMLLSDVCQAGVHNLPYADIITFGSPCQDLSVAGRREGLQGGRSGLFYEAVRIVREINPRYAIWENVPGALSSNHGRDFKSVLESLLDTSIPMPRSGRWATAGMVRSGQKEIAWRILDSQYFGVAQRRRRLFLIYCPRGNSASQVLFEPESTPRDPEKGRKEGQETSRDPVTSTLRGFGQQGQHNDTNAVAFPDPAYAVQGVGTKFGSGRHNQDTFVTYSPFSHYGYTEADQSATLQGRENRQNGSMNVIFQQNTRDEVRLIDGDGQIAGAVASRPGVKQQNYVANTNDQNSAGVRIQVNADKAVTLQGLGGGMSAKTGMYTTKKGVRRLTPTECERLQAFPDNYTAGQADSVRYRQLGNAVTVSVITWLAKRILLADRNK